MTDPHTPDARLLDMAHAAVEVHLELKPRYKITEAHRATAAGLLAAVWTLTEGMGIDRDMWRSVTDLPGTCLRLAELQHDRAAYRTQITPRRTPAPVGPSAMSAQVTKGITR